MHWHGWHGHHWHSSSVVVNGMGDVATVIVVNGMGDMGAVVIVGVVMAHIVSKLVSIWKKLVLKKKKTKQNKTPAMHGHGWRCHW